MSAKYPGQLNVVGLSTLLSSKNSSSRKKQPARLQLNHGRPCGSQSPTSSVPTRQRPLRTGRLMAQNTCTQVQELVKLITIFYLIKDILKTGSYFFYSKRYGANSPYQPLLFHHRANGNSGKKANNILKLLQKEL